MQYTRDLFHRIWTSLMHDMQPSGLLQEISKHSFVFRQFPFYFLNDLKKVNQSPQYHPEGNVWNHTLMVVDEAAKRRSMSKNPEALMWAALLHDIGKPMTTKVRNGRITAYDHDKKGAALASIFLSEFYHDIDFIEKVSRLVRWHMQIFFLSRDLPFSQIDTMLGEVEIEEIARLSLCDRLGRGGLTERDRHKEAENIQLFLRRYSYYQ